MNVRAPAGYAAIITAAGRGSRAGGAIPKQWRELAGRTVLARAIAAFAGFDRVILVVHPDDMARAIRAFSGSVAIV
nr:2-C-methyl-D-erythritol 4-phosphate cytidylyltransferase [Paracoccus sp. (in: a-proteobacteria)]